MNSLILGRRLSMRIILPLAGVCLILIFLGIFISLQEVTKTSNSTSSLSTYTSGELTRTNETTSNTTISYFPGSCSIKIINASGRVSAQSCVTGQILAGNGSNSSNSCLSGNNASCVFQDAINDLELTKGILLVEPGEYLITNTVTLYDGITLTGGSFGWGYSGDVLSPSLLIGNLSGPIIQILQNPTDSRADFGGIQYLGITGSGNPNYVRQDCILINYTSGFIYDLQFEYLGLNHCYNGIDDVGIAKTFINNLYAEFNINDGVLLRYGSLWISASNFGQNGVHALQAVVAQIFSVSNSRIFGSGQEGIWCQSSPTNSLITQNEIINNGSPLYADILLEGLNKPNQIENNIFVETRTANSSGAKAAIEVGIVPDFIQISGNTFFGFTSPIIGLQPNAGNEISIENNTGYGSTYIPDPFYTSQSLMGFMGDGGGNSPIPPNQTTIINQFSPKNIYITIGNWNLTEGHLFGLTLDGVLLFSSVNPTPQVITLRVDPGENFSCTYTNQVNFTVILE